VKFLFVIHNSVALNNMKPYIQAIFSGFPKASLVVTFFDSDHHFDLEENSIADLGLDFIFFESTLCYSWDVIFFAAHGGAHLFPETSVKVHVQHGLGAGKIVGMSNYTYGSDWVLQNGKPIYDLFFESSIQEAIRIAVNFPHVAQGLRVVGSPLLDFLIEQQSNTSEIRTHWGIHPNQTVIGLLSTWGDHTLIDDISQVDNLLIQSLHFDDCLIPIVHPNMRKSMSFVKILDLWQNKTSNTRIIMPNTFQDSLRAISIMDYAITDHTSTALLLTGLATPLFKSHENRCAPSVDTNSTIAQLLRHIPVAETREQMITKSSLLRARQVSKYIGKHLFSYRGRSELKIVQTIKDALQESMLEKLFGGLTSKNQMLK
jgi:hypothetical protein